MDSLSVILPAYNEEGNIPLLMEKIDLVFTKNNLKGEVLLINDGSTDKTVVQAEECAKKYAYLRVYHHQRNLGLTKALSTGFKNSKGDIVVFLCADLQSDPEEDIPKLLEALKDNADVVVGWRQGRKESKLLGSKIYNIVSKVLFNVTVHDQNWIKAFKREFLDGLILRSDWHRFLVAIAIHRGFKVVEVKTNWYPRKHGVSKFGFARIPIAVLDMFALKIEMLFIENPMRFFGSLGILSFLTGIGVGISLFVCKNFVGINISEVTSVKYFLLSALIILFGTGLFSVGLLGEFIVSYLEKMREGKK